MNGGGNGHLKLILLIITVILIGYLMGVNHEVIQRIVYLLLN